MRSSMNAVRRSWKSRQRSLSSKSMIWGTLAQRTSPKPEGSSMATATSNERIPVPRDRDNDYTREAAGQRQEFVRERTGAQLEHVSSYSFDPGILTGNVEQFVGVAQ